MNLKGSDIYKPIMEIIDVNVVNRRLLKCLDLQLIFLASVTQVRISYSALAVLKLFAVKFIHNTHATSCVHVCPW